MDHDPVITLTARTYVDLLNGLDAHDADSSSYDTGEMDLGISGDYIAIGTRA